MVAAHYQVNVGIARLREIAGTDRQGTNLAGIIKAARHLGLEATAYRSDRQTVDRRMPTPFIAHVVQKTQSDEITHYVVVTKITGTRVTCLDPAVGRTTASLTEFARIWSGYLVAIRRNPEIKIASASASLLGRFLPILKPHLGELIQVGVSTVMLTIFGIVSSLFFSFLIDEIIPGRSDMTLHVFSFGILILTLVQASTEAIRSIISTQFSIKVDYSLIVTYFRHVFRLPLSFFDSRKSGEILSRLQDAQRIRSALSEVAITMVMDTILVTAIGVVLYLQSPLLFTVVVATVPISAIVVFVFSRLYSRRYRLQMKQNQEVQSFMVEAVNASLTIKSMNASTHIVREFERRQGMISNTSFSLGTVQNTQQFIIQLVDGWGHNLLFWVGSFLVLHDTMSLGQLIAFNMLLGFFLAPLQRLLRLQSGLQAAFVAAERMAEMLDLKPEETDGVRSTAHPQKLSGGITAHGVSFRYGTRQLALDSVSFQILPGECVAFVGSSGCGKSTLMKLFMKLYPVESGLLEIDGHDIAGIDPSWLRNRIGFVPQDVYLFSGTIAENIALGQPDASLDEIRDAARRAKAHEFIQKMPGQYSTEIAERGASLSGGERQRIAIARALLGSPDLLLFDEATSNLDNLSEQEIFSTFRALSAHRVTTVLIAHRLTTVVDCDRIFVMDAGKIVESGRHSELIQAAGPYSRLWASVSE